MYMYGLAHAELVHVYVRVQSTHAYAAPGIRAACKNHMHGTCWHAHACMHTDGAASLGLRMLNMVRQSLFACLHMQVLSHLYAWEPCPHRLCYQQSVLRIRSPSYSQLLTLWTSSHSHNQRYYQLAARRVDPQPLLQPAPLPAPRAVVPQPQPQPAPQPALQPLPQPAASLYTAPQATPNTVNPVQVMVPAGLYLGHGVIPLPQRLLTKILNLEFVEMQDLLPEAWLTLTDDDAAKYCSTSAAGGRKRRPPVTNIFTWLQGFASMVSALSTKYPGMVPEFLAYQSTIIKCYKDYDGLGWVHYDRAFRRQVAITKNLNWSHINVKTKIRIFHSHFLLR